MGKYLISRSRNIQIWQNIILRLKIFFVGFWLPDKIVSPWFSRPRQFFAVFFIIFGSKGNAPTIEITNSKKITIFIQGNYIFTLTI